jgi:hypothetical protein
VQVVYDQIDGLEIPALNATLLCIPARGVPDIERRILQPSPNTRYNLLLLHGLLEGVTQLTLERPIDRQKIVRDEWDYIALGDWHMYHASCAQRGLRRRDRVHQHQHLG